MISAREEGLHIGEVAVVTLNRPQKKNPLTFDSYGELRDTFRTLVDCDDVKAVVAYHPAPTKPEAPVTRPGP